MVDKAFFADPDREVFPVKARNLPQSMPHTYARTGPGIGWPGQPSRYCLGTGSYYTCTAMGNRAFALSREGNARMLAVLECAAVHGFPLWYCQQATQKELLKYFGNSICPPVAKAVHLSIERVGISHLDAPSPAALIPQAPQFEAPLLPGCVSLQGPE